MAVLLITHDLNLVRRFADRVAVMENGHLVEQGAVATVFGSAAASLHPQADRQPAGARRRRRRRARARDAGDARPSALRVSYPVPRAGLARLVPQGRVRRGAGRRLCALRPGETLGVVGESGSGKSTLALAALGLMPHRRRA